MAPTLSWDDVKRHHRKDDCWVVIHNQVWDLTEFASEHPGGSAIIFKYAGRDATKAFDPIHPSDITESLPPSCFKGSIDPNDAKPVVEEEKVPAKPTSTSSVTLASMFNVYDFEQVARANCGTEAWAYLNSGGDDEVTLRENTTAYHRIWLRPRVLRNVKYIDMSTTLLGVKTRLPLFVCATALGKLYHPRGEMELCLGCHKAGIIQMCPTLASCSLDEMARERHEGQTQWYQLYVNGDKNITKRVVQKAEQLGFKGLFITVDAPALGRRERDMRCKSHMLSEIQKDMDSQDSGKRDGVARSLSSFIDPSLSWKDIPWFKSVTRMPIMIKGIQTAEDALLAAKSGVQGILVSNHGGRQLDYCRSAIECLAEIMPALRSANIDLSKFEVFVDGGLRRGTDIFKALALGARAVGIGRPAMFALAAFGQDGVKKCVDLLADELSMCMRLMGTPSIADIRDEMVITKNLSDHVELAPRVAGFDRNYEPLPGALSKM